MGQGPPLDPFDQVWDALSLAYIQVHKAANIM